MKNIAIFASGRGSNARKIMEYFSDNPDIEVALVLSNRKKAPVLEISEQFGVETFTFDRTIFYDSITLLHLLKEKNIHLLVLAGFLWLIPKYLIFKYPNKIVNLHPALLPKYGGKGMYGSNVHEAVKAANEIESGITIHYVNEAYDDGQIIFQAKCKLEEQDDSPAIAHKVQQLEHQFFAPIIASLLENNTHNLTKPT